MVATTWGKGPDKDLAYAETTARIDELNSRVRDARWQDLGLALMLSQEAVLEAEAIGDARRLAYSSLNLAHVKLRLSHYTEAITLLTSLLPYFYSVSDKAGEQACLSRMGDAYSELGQLGDALTCYLQSLKLSREGGDPEDEINCLNNLGVFYEELGDYNSASENYLGSLRLATQLDKGRERSLALINLGEVRRKLGQFGEALKAHTEGYALSVASNNTFLTGAAATGIGSDLYALKRFDEALVQFERGREVLQSIGERRYELDALWGLGLTYSQMKQPEDARCCYNEALVLARSIGYPLGEATTLGHLGQTCLDENNVAEAITLLEQSLAMAERFGFSSLTFETHQRLSYAWERQGDVVLALRHYRTFHEGRERVSADQARGQAQALFVQMEVEKAQHQAEVERLKRVELARLNKELEGKARENAKLVDELKRQAQEDALTGLPNRRIFTGWLNDAHQRAVRKRASLVIALADIDNFKRINDDYSHAVGDEVLKKVSRIFLRSLRSIDTVSRIGGEEFAFIFPDTEAEEARSICERLRVAIVRNKWGRLHPDLNVTVSIGLAHDTSFRTAEKMLAQADAKLYEAKRTGKNRIA